MAQAAWPLESAGSGRHAARCVVGSAAAEFLGFSAFVVYSTWAAFQGNHYESGPYLSPFYSPLLFGDGPHAWFGPQPGWWPGALPFSAALLILWAPGGFRFTCYYYRGRLLQGVLGRSAGLHRRRAAQDYLGERSFPADHAERPPLLPLSRAPLHRHPDLRRLDGDVVHRTLMAARVSASASGRSSWPPTPCCSAATPSAATRCGTSSAAGATRSRSRPSVRPATRAPAR